MLLYTLHCGNLYGTERMALATLEGLAEYRRLVMAPRAPSPSLLEAAQALGYETRVADTTLQVVRALAPLFLRHRRIDVVSTSVRHNVICAWLARACFVRLRQLNVVHGGGHERDSYAKKRHLNGMRNRLVAVSRFVGGRLLAHGVEPDKIVVIENFLSPSDLASRPRRPAFDASVAGSRPLDPACVRVAVVSRLDPVKRLELLLDAVGTGALADFRFDVYGSGALLETYRERAAALGGTVVFHGYATDVAARLPDADLLLHLCPDEPFGLIVLEAFAAGLPVLVPRSGGVGELVDDGVTGITYPPENAAVLVDCLRRTAKLAPARLDAIAAAGRGQMETRYSAGAGAEAYRRALAQAGP